MKQYFNHNNNKFASTKMQFCKRVILNHNSVQTDWEIFCRCSLLNFDIFRRLFYNLQHICTALDHRWMNRAKRHNLRVNRDAAFVTVPCPPPPAAPPPSAPHTPAEGYRGSALSSLKLHTLLYKCCIPVMQSLRGFYRSTPLLHLRLSFFFLSSRPPLHCGKGVGRIYMHQAFKSSRLEQRIT